jgi:hypothetical protein
MLIYSIDLIVTYLFIYMQIYIPPNIGGAPSILCASPVTKSLASEGSRRGYNMAEEQAVGNGLYDRSGESTSELYSSACLRYSSLTSS